MTGKPPALYIYIVPIGALIVGIFFHLGDFTANAVPFSVRMILSLGMLVVLFAAVFVVLQHAEILATKLGQPYGTLLLTFSVTTVEVAIIVSLMLNGANNPTLAREWCFQRS